MLSAKSPIILVIEGSDTYDEFYEKFKEDIKSQKLILLNKEEVKISGIIALIVRLNVKTLIFQDCEFDEDTKVIEPLVSCLSLEKVQFINCRKEYLVMMVCITAPNLKVCINGKHEKLWRRFDVPHLVNFLEAVGSTGILRNNYRLIKFEISHFKEYFADIAKNDKLRGFINRGIDSQFKIALILQRNFNGYQKCRKVIYTLFLIKKYGNHPIMTLMDRNILMIIGKEILTSIGDKMWCQDN